MRSAVEGLLHDVVTFIRNKMKNSCHVGVQGDVVSKVTAKYASSMC